MRKQTIVEDLRAKQSRDNRELLDRAADDIEYLEAEAVKWHHEYHKVKEDLRQAKMYENSANKLAEQYHEELQTAKAEIAREIFSEILNIIRGYSHSACIAKNNYGITQAEYIGTDILKLKKKYTEGQK